MMSKKVVLIRRAFLHSIKFLCVLLICISCNGKAEVQTDNLKITNGKKVTFIELGSDSCVPCQAMEPILETIRNDLSDQVEVLFYDVWTDEGKPYGEKFKIRVIPTQIFLNEDGEEYFRHVGYFPIEELYSILEKGGVILP